jgi:hypothetical protein
MPLSPSERTMRAQIAANVRWAHTVDRKTATAEARRGFNARFEREVDPHDELSPEERARRAEYARKAHMQRLALKSARARRRRGAMDKAETTGPGGAR